MSGVLRAPSHGLGESELLPHHREELERSGIDRKVIREAGLRSICHEEAHERWGFRNGGGDAGGLLFPFRDVISGTWSDRFATLKPDLRTNGKYLSPVGEMLRFYFTPGVTADDLKDPAVPIYIIEGVKKALAVVSWCRRASVRAVVIGISGCWGWRRRIKGTLPDGSLGTVRRLPIPDFDLIVWQDREVIIGLDGDIATNEDVARAERALLRELRGRGARVRVLRIPPAADGARRGADDYLVQEGDEAWAKRIDEAQEASRPTIIIGTDVQPVVDQALAAIVADNRGIFRRGQSLVRIVTETDRPKHGIIRPQGARIISTISEPALFEILSMAADWVAVKVVEKLERQKRIMPPAWAVKVLLSRGDWRGIPWLEGITTAPTMRPDGTVLDRAGYDAATGLLYDPGDTVFPPLKPRPTQDDARAALTELVEPFNEFCYSDPKVGPAAVASAILSLIGRGAIPGPVPMFPIRSTTPGSGKGLMADGIIIIGTGREPARMILPVGRGADEEMRKRVLALALEGDSAILLDNIEGAIGSPTLASVLTAVEFKDRMLSESRTGGAPLRMVWFVTGNGVTFRGDLGRRVVPIDQDPDVEHPEDRTGPCPGESWKHPDLLAYIRDARPRLVVAALTILRAFHMAGRPAHGKPPKGSFEAWDHLIRASVIWSGGADPLDACTVVREEADADKDALRAAAHCWRQVFGERDLTAAEALRDAQARADDDESPDAELLTALAALAETDLRRLDGRRLGNALKRVKGRIAGGLKFLDRGRDRNAKICRWQVVAVEP
jgi:hypothetical protein